MIVSLSRNPATGKQDVLIAAETPTEVAVIADPRLHERLIEKLVIGGIDRADIGEVIVQTTNGDR